MKEDIIFVTIDQKLETVAIKGRKTAEGEIYLLLSEGQ